MADTYTLIEKIVVGAASASSVTFTSIPQTYTDLKVVFSARSTDTYGNAWYDSYVTLNSTSGSSLVLYANESGNVSGVDASNTAIYGITSSGATASTFGSAEFYVPNYTGSTTKTVSIDSVSENNASASIAHIGASRHSLTSAVTSITITPYNSPTAKFAQYSTFYLYGIAKEGVTPSLPSAPYATGGDSILFDGTYWIHTFLSSGTFTPKKSLTCDYLVVAGGGGGGVLYGGGGGGGGLRSTVTATGGGGSLESALSLTGNTAYTVTVGAGGAGSTTSTVNASNGGNSVFSSITSTGGGGGGSNESNGSAGGSGAGGGGSGVASKSGGSGTSNEGYNGGNNFAQASVGPAGGGGGAGATGANAISNKAGNGGNGVAVAISGSSITYAGGGGGGIIGGTAGTGGTGGGAAGSTSTNGSNATSNTGGGAGGGGGGSGNGGNGGSGIVIVRYAA